MKKRKSSFFKRGLALMLSVAMMAGSVPATGMAAESSSGIVVTDADKTVDVSTMNDWANYFKDSNTEYAGGVWTDKSVSDDAEDLIADIQTMPDGSTEEVDGLDALGITSDNNNFLVSMSALASNTEVVGYSTIPTDTILVLDASDSMDNSGSVDEMVNAANDAMKRLLELNKNNRVGVILYSGNHSFGTSNTATATVLFELGRYTPNRLNEFITQEGWWQDNGYSGDTWETRIEIADGVKYGDNGEGDEVTEVEKLTEGGTYIQNGLSKAKDMFLAVQDTTIEEGNVQGGTKRMPVFVLMSDGAPTTGTPNYTNVQTSSVGNGGASSAGLGFMTQLTAAYARAQVEKHYDNEAKFYTLGLNLSEQDDDAEEIALSVLDPSNSIQTIDNYWNSLFTNGYVRFQSPGTETNNNDNDNIWVTVNRAENDGLTRPDSNDSSDETKNSQEYVDRYFKADNTAGLENIFREIVNEIILQSAYYPTLVEDGEHDLGGYVSFEDEIGQFMEVKDIKGILLDDNKLFTGEVIAQEMQNGTFGNRNTFTELGWELVRTVSERIGVTQDVAIALLRNAWTDGQLSYDAETGSYSNYIGWYEGEDGSYIGYWNDKDTAEDKPDNAKYISKSYGYFGTVQAQNTIVDTNMMHIVVKVRTEITTGHQDVVFQIPSSLIPVSTYHVELNTDSFDTADEISLVREEERPIRLLFEVGLRSDITEWNINEKLAEANLVEGQHVHKNSDGTYYFYTNEWAEDVENLEGHPLNHLVAESHFHPSVENARYYYTENSLVYVKTGDTYKVYEGEELPSGTYYHRNRVFETTDNGTIMSYLYTEIADSTLEKAQRTEGADTWYIPIGEIRHREAAHVVPKQEDNPTDTLYYSDYPVIQPVGDGTTYDVYAFLGNNGRLLVKPATGIKLTKAVDETVTDKAATFTFVITMDETINDTYTLVDSEGTERELTFTGGKSANIILTAGETVYITGLPAGGYTVEEMSADGYKVSSIQVDSEEPITGVSQVTDTLELYKLDSVVFTNTVAKDGELVINKTVTHDFGDDYAIPAIKFDVTVTLKDDEGKAIVSEEFETTQGSKTTDANGKITFELAHNEAVTIKGLPEGTQYEVTETDLQKGFTLVSSDDYEGTIVEDTTSTVNLVNDYEPTGSAPTADIDIEVTKTLKDVNGENVEWGNKSFTFYLEKQKADGTWEQVVDGEKAITATVSSSTANPFTVYIPEGSLDEVGTYLFRIHEDENNLGAGVVSDTAIYFTIIVTDKDMDGSLEVDEILIANNSIDFENGFDMTFNNVYVVEGALTIEIPVEKAITNKTGITLLPGGFQFGLYEDDATEPVATGTSNDLGEATIYLSYTSADYQKDVVNDADGIVEKEYILKEISPENKLPGMTYSSVEYNVKATIGLDVNNKLVLNSLEITDSNGKEVEAEFTNTYELDPAKFELSGTKNMTGGRDLSNNEFSFAMYEADADFVVVADGETITANNDKNAFKFTKEITTAGTFYYVVEEVIPTDNEKISGVTYDTTKYHVTVVTNVGTGEDADKLVVESTTINKVGGGIVDKVEFTNEYKVSPITVDITGTKSLTDENGEALTLRAGEYEFVLSEVVTDNQGETTTTEVAKVVNNTTGTFVFEDIEFTKAGTYKYIIKETYVEKDGYTYDKSEYQVDVVVEDNGDGTLSAAQTITKVKNNVGAEASGTASEIKFTNIYDPADAVINLNAEKFLDNRDLANGEFEFELYETDADFVVDTGATPLSTTKNDANGEFSFSITKAKTGMYYYVVKEKIPSASDSNYDSNVEYDPTEYQITVIVYDQSGINEEGVFEAKLSSRVTYAVEGRDVSGITFSNTYFVPKAADLVLEATKELSNHALGNEEFEFELYQVADDKFEIAKDAEPVQTAKNDADGKVTFDALHFGAEEMSANGTVLDSKNFYYVIKEAVPTEAELDEVTGLYTLNGITYDNSYFEVTVNVSDNGARQFVTTTNITKVDGEEETANITAMEFNNSYVAADAELTLGGTKVLNDKDLKAEEFKFALYEADEKFNKGRELDRKANKADGTFAFDSIKYSEANTYYYVVEEVAGDDEKVTYDTTRYEIKVEVKDDGLGQYRMDITYANDIKLTQKDVAEVTELNFTNGYNPDDAVVNLGGKKTLEGKTLENREFEFVITESGEEVDRKANEEDGTFAFDSLTFDKAGTYNYVIEEVVPADKQGVSYDTTKYEIEVEVVNTMKGDLKATVYVDGDKVDDKANVVEFTKLNFTNTYKATLPEGFGLSIVAQKNLTGDRDKVKDKEFTFVLSEITEKDGKEVVTEISRAKNNADGEILFDDITYDEAGTYYYRVAEVKGDKSGIIYDTTEYEVEVTVVDDGEGNLIIKEPVSTMSGQKVDKIEFNNIYDKNLVKTGDIANVMLYFAATCLSMAAILTVFYLKRRTVR